jgi:tripartite ATP-independent transporter DctP family solute receptor
MRIWTRFAIYLFAGTVCLGLVAPTLVSAAKQVRLTSSSDTSHPNHLALERMVKRISERTNGEIDITIFPKNALGSPPETTEQVRLGVIDMGIMSPSQIDKYDPAFGVVMIPYQFDSFEHAYKTLDGPAMDWFKEKGEKAGFVLIANFEWGFRALTNSLRPVNSPDDIKGMKLRVPPEIQIKAAMEALGAVTHTIAFPEVYMALASKTVDGQDNPVPTDYASKFYEVQNYLALTKHVYNQMILVSSIKFWNSLSPEFKQIITEEGIKAGNEARKEVQEKEKWYIAEMEKSGVETTYPDVAPFRALMEPAYNQIKEFVGEENWNTWKKFVDEAK